MITCWVQPVSLCSCLDLSSSSFQCPLISVLMGQVLASECSDWKLYRKQRRLTIRDREEGEGKKREERKGQRDI